MPNHDFSPSSKRLRIAFVVHDYNRHIGHSRYVAELASRMKFQHDVHVFADTFEEPDSANLSFHHVPKLRFNTLASILSLIPSTKLFVRGNFDVIHAQGFCGLGHNLTTAHICQSAWFDVLKSQGIRLNWRQKVFQTCVTGLEKKAICQPSTKGVIAVSERVRRDLKNYYGRDHDVDVIYHGVDTQLFHPDNRERYRDSIRQELGLNDDFLALFVGDLQKGAAAAIRATARVPGMNLLLASSSQDAAYRQLANQERVADRVVFSPHRKDIERLFAAVDALLFPTVYDSFGLVIAEAMASGLPVITSCAAGAAELIRPDVDGFVTQRPWDVDDLCRHLTLLRDAPSLRSRIGDSARAAIEPWTWDRCAEATLKTYHRIVANQ